MTILETIELTADQDLVALDGSLQIVVVIATMFEKPVVTLERHLMRCPVSSQLVVVIVTPFGNVVAVEPGRGVLC